MMSVQDMPGLIEIRNGSPSEGVFSDREYDRRLAGLRSAMARDGIDIALFTSFHNMVQLYSASVDHRNQYPVVNAG